MRDTSYQVCTRCVMDTTDVDIHFDEDGVCNHCHFHNELSKALPFGAEEKKNLLSKQLEEIRQQGRTSKYDCVCGVSGGVDSSYLAFMLKQFGLRVLLVHVDNGWNSELAVKNIENIAKMLDFDLYTNVLDWNEFRDLQIAYLRSSVIDFEAISDHAINATLYQVASKYNIKYIISGTNYETESILPESWRYSSKLMDDVNIKAIHKRYGTRPLRTFPLIGVWKYIYYTKIRGIRMVALLNLLPYDKAVAKQTIADQIGWRDYGGKHYESIITRFYQGYILPRKYNVDKRRAHLSNLVLGGQITRDAALEVLKEPALSSEVLKQDGTYVPKKLGLSKDELNAILSTVAKHNKEYPNNEKLQKFFMRLNANLQTILRR